MPKARMIVADYEGDDPAGAMKAALDGFFAEQPAEIGEPVARSIPGIPPEIWFDIEAGTFGEFRDRATGEWLGDEMFHLYLPAVARFLAHFQGNPGKTTEKTDGK